MLSHCSHVQLFATLWTVACQAPLSMGFCRQRYWNRLPFPPPRDLPDPGIKPTSFRSPALADRFFTTTAEGGNRAGLHLRPGSEHQANAWSPSPWTLNFVPGIYRNGIQIETRAPR